MSAQVELLVLLAVIAGGIAYVVVRVRRGALEQERAKQADADAGRDPGTAVDPDTEQDDGAEGE